MSNNINTKNIPAPAKRNLFVQNKKLNYKKKILQRLVYDLYCRWFFDNVWLDLYLTEWIYFKWGQ